MLCRLTLSHVDDTYHLQHIQYRPEVKPIASGTVADDDARELSSSSNGEWRWGREERIETVRVGNGRPIGPWAPEQAG